MNRGVDSLDGILAARQADVVDVDEPTIKLVLFELHGDWFAFPGANVREILPQTEIYFVPGCPPSLEGVVNVRGDIESVLRLDELLGKTSQQAIPQASFSILLAQGDGMRSGIRVDKVVDVLDAPDSAIQPTPPTLPEARQRLVSGVMRYKDRPVLILDVERVFADYLSSTR